MSETSRLTSLRLADSFLPVGSYTASFGLEQFVQADDVTTGDELESLLETYLTGLVGPGDLVVLRAAHSAAGNGNVDGVCAADRRSAATTLAAELRESAKRTGDRLLSLETELRDDAVLDTYAHRVPDDAPGMYPAVLGAVTGCAGISAHEACLVYCHSFVTGLLGVVQRLLSLGHTDAQRILTAVHPTIRAAVADSTDRSLEEVTPFAPLIDVATADHERADRRLFMS